MRSLDVAVIDEIFCFQDKLSEKFRCCKMGDFEEGYIGKLQIHKSGRTRLVLGSVALDVNMGMPTGFLQVVCFFLPMFIVAAM